MMHGFGQASLRGLYLLCIIKQYMSMGKYTILYDPLGFGNVLERNGGKRDVRIDQTDHE